MVSIFTVILSLPGVSRDKKPTQEDRIASLEAQISVMGLRYQDDVGRLYARTDDLNERLKKFEGASSRAQVMEQRVAEIRLDVDDLNDRVKVFEESDYSELELAGN